jgi:NADPH:quinone reductase-like Zn-dependent oxidoreductase
VPVNSFSEKPSNVSLLEAGSIGVPFITAYEGLRRAGFPTKGDNVLVFGANGKVGQAVIQLASRHGARVFGVEREKNNYQGHSNTEVTMISSSEENVSEVIREQTKGHGVDLIFNTVGSPYFEIANLSLAIKGRQIFISTIERSVPFDILQFFRGDFSYYGVDSGKLTTEEAALILNTIKPWFEEGTLKPYRILEENIYSLEHIKQAYEAVLKGAKERILIKAQ